MCRTSRFHRIAITTDTGHFAVGITLVLGRCCRLIGVQDQAWSIFLGCPGAADGPEDHFADVQTSRSARKAVQQPEDGSFIAATGGQ
ncbi:hypothetical protein [Plantactinospora mayteni]|uniref:hypothetical protein n=1 Tax=Plantactinospora mayteni TaxID=566021 RepID=UPI0019452E94|nr:hypothetical protein [Plantactinospora mayteni]